MAQDNPLQIKDIVLTGKMITAVSLVGENFSNLVNMRYSQNGIESIGGYTKINTTALSTYLKVRSGFDYKKDAPSESHVLVQAYNTGLTASQIYDNTASVPAQGDFSATVIFSDSSGSGIGRFDTAPNGDMAYCNGVDSCIWSGAEGKCSGFVNYDPGGGFFYDYTDQVTNTTTADKASVSVSSGGIDADVMLMLHLDNNVTDSSPTTAHTVTNNNVTFSSSDKVFGTYSAVFNGTDGALTVPDDADFYFSGSAFTVDTRLKVDDLAAEYPFYYQSHEIQTLAFTSGGTYQIVEGDTITGATGSATAVVHHIVLSSGTWAGGDAAGTIYFRTADKTGTFQAENLDVGAELNVATIAGDSVVAGDDYIKLSITTSGQVRFKISQTYGTEDIDLTSTAVISAGTWYQVEVVASSSKAYIFVDGTLRAYSATAFDYEDYTSVVYIGYDGTTYFKGKMDEYRVSDVARHTANFETPTVAYSSGSTSTYFYVGSLKPIQGMKFYVGTANTTTGTTAVQYWDGDSWESVTSLSDGTSVGGKTFTQTGSITFDDTSLLAKIKYINKTLIYWYKVYINSCDSGTTIYYVTLDSAFQGIKDIWDGQTRTCLSFQKYSGGTYQDLTVNVVDEDYTSADTASYADLSSLATATDYVVAGFIERQTALIFTMVGGSENTTAGTIATVYYYNGAGWSSVGDIEDGTIEGGISFAKSGVMSWDAPAESAEFKTDITREYKLYYYKIVFSQNLSSDVKVDFISGIPAQKSINGFKFPLHAQDRLWLCGDQTKDKNSAIVSAFGTSVVFNGNDSTTFYFGDDTEITAGVSLYGQFSSNLYDIVVVCKKNETWVVVGSGNESWSKYPASRSIGCIAPLTMTTANVAVEIVEGVKRSENRQVAIFQSADGIYIFDGRSFHPIHGDISDIFDKREPNGINQDKIEDSVGFFDEYNQEYHFLFASGSSTTLDKEYVFSILKQAWFKVERETPLQFGMSIRSADGANYNYGTIDTGYMYRLENGNDFDGNDITSTFETGDVYLSGSPMIESTVRIVKLTTKSKTTTTNDVSMSHYGDSSSTATISSRAMEPSVSGKTLAMPLKTEKLGPFTTHRFKLDMTTNNEVVGFEPYVLSLAYKNVRIDKN